MLLGAIAAVLAAGEASALAQRTFVASYGSDGNPCTVVDPCRSFGAALSKTADNGEIIVIDTAGYGSVTVTKSVSIIAPSGIYAGISVGSGANGVTINAAGVRVRLKGLTINGISPSSSDGVLITQAASVSIEDCTIANMGQWGINSNASTDVTITGTTLRGNQSDAVVQNGSGRLAMQNSRAIGNAHSGIHTYAGKLDVSGSLFVGNGVHGVQIEGTVGPASLSITSSSVLGHSGGSGIGVASNVLADPASAVIAGNTIVGSGNGIVFAGGISDIVTGDISGNQINGSVQRGIYLVGAQVKARVSGNGVFANTTGLDPVGGAVLFTPGDNYVRDNGTNSTGSTADTLL